MQKRSSDKCFTLDENNEFKKNLISNTNLSGLLSDLTDISLTFVVFLFFFLSVPYVRKEKTKRKKNYSRNAVRSSVE